MTRSYDECLPRVTSALNELPDTWTDTPERLEEAMRYSLLAGGKRLRPVLALMTADLLQVDEQVIMPYALAIEMIHTYSLIHDDLPAMDNDDLRRGKPTSHKKFGEALAILAGDALLNGAAEMMLKAALSRSDLRGVMAAEAIMRRAGITGMIAGQSVDVLSEGLTEPDESRVIYIHTHKTADLLTAPLEAAACLAGVEDDMKEALCDYGFHLGLAFQIVDDVLDVTGNEAEMGKRTGLDAEAGKQTWVAIQGLDGAREDAAEHIRQAIQALAKVPGDTTELICLAEESLTRIR